MTTKYTHQSYLLPIAVSRLLSRVLGCFLAVRGRVDHPLASVILRRQLDRVRVVEAGDHHVAVVTDRVFRIHIVVVERI